MKCCRWILICCLAWMLPAALASEIPAPDAAKYAHREVKLTTGGKGATSYWLYEPADPKPAKPAPVIYFLHGWSAMDPWVYSAWIHHLVKQGNVVIYPKYQDSVLTSPTNFLPNTLKAIQAALAITKTPEHVAVDEKRCAMIGHSAGGILTASLPGVAAASGIPVPRGIVCVQPGKTSLRGGFGIKLLNLAAMPADTLLLCITGDADSVCGDTDARRILKETPQIPKALKGHLVQVSTPAQRASHYVPCSPDFTAPLEKFDENASEVAAMAGVLTGDLTVLRSFLRTDRGKKWLQNPQTRASFTETFSPPDAFDFGLWLAADRLIEASFQRDKKPDLALGRDEKAKALGKWMPVE
jgi:pimeloyl-ACP methyl ester carboxylesterase